jgi:hypothetical protein
MSRQSKNMFVPERLLLCLVGIALAIIAFPPKPFAFHWEHVTFLVVGVILFMTGVLLDAIVNGFKKHFGLYWKAFGPYWGTGIIVLFVALVTGLYFLIHETWLWILVCVCVAIITGSMVRDIIKVCTEGEKKE